MTLYRFHDFALCRVRVRCKMLRVMDLHSVAAVVIVLRWRCRQCNICCGRCANDTNANMCVSLRRNAFFKLRNRPPTHTESLKEARKLVKKTLSSVIVEPAGCESRPRTPRCTPEPPKTRPKPSQEPPKNPPKNPPRTPRPPKIHPRSLRNHPQNHLPNHSLGDDIDFRKFTRSCVALQRHKYKNVRFA